MKASLVVVGRQESRLLSTEFLTWKTKIWLKTGGKSMAAFFRFRQTMCEQKKLVQSKFKSDTDQLQRTGR